MTDSAATPARPVSVRAYVVLLALSALFMALLGWSASAYYVPALCLALLALLLWRGRGYGWFKWTLLLNQLSGLVLILVLWLGDGLGSAKLDVSGVALLTNLLCGGPLASLWAIPIVPGLRRGRRLFQWFNPRAA